MGAAKAPAVTIRRRCTVRRTAGGLIFTKEHATTRGMRNPFRRFFPRKPIGFPLGQRILADPADHAEDFAIRYAEPLDWRAGIRMEELGISRDRIGSNDHLHGLLGRAFNPFEREGGGINHAGQVNIDSGMLNPELLTEDYGTKAGRLWARSRLRDRQDAPIAHEDAEWRMGGDHDAAVRVAPETELPISDRARGILRAMRRGWRGR
jgi:hypothetical protein